MKTHAIACLSVWLLLSVAVIEASSIGRVIAIQGQAIVIGIDGNTRRLRLKSPIFLNDKIATQTGSKIQIMFEDDSIISQGEKSEMVIDEYVYTPKDEEKVNSSFKLVKGIFRMVTGKITDLNPERFKVRTRMATIGIRGCELAFRIHKGKEIVYVLDLPEGDSILIERILTADEFLPEALIIVNAGVAVSIQQGERLKQYLVTTLEHRQIIKDSTPASGSEERSSGRRDEDASSKSIAGMDVPTYHESRDTVIGFSEAAREAYEKKLLEDPLPLPTSGPTSAPSPPPLPDEDRPYPVGGSPMTRWEWGVWESGRIFISGNRFIDAAFLTDSEYQIIRNGATYNLFGNGKAGAVLKYAGKTSYVVDNNCTLNVTVGGGTDGSWNTSVDTDRVQEGCPGDLQFTVENGEIQDDGRLTLGTLGTLTSYSMDIDGNTFDGTTLNTKTIEGYLIRVPGSAKPADGAAAEGHFRHSNGASADVAIGVDF